MQREETDRMGQMERGHTAEVQPDCMTEAYTVGISETHIRNNATVFRVWQMIECGELTREEGLYLMVNTLADENHRLNQMCNDLIMRMPSPDCTHCENRKGTWIDTITSLLGTKAVVVLEDGKVETYPLDRLKVITKRER